MNAIGEVLQKFSQNEDAVASNMLHADNSVFDNVYQIASLVAKRNAVMSVEHPTDSLKAVLYDFPSNEEAYTNARIEDEHLPGFMIPSVYAILYYVSRYMRNGQSFEASLDYLNTRGAFTYLSAYGRSGGATDYTDTIRQMKRYCDL